MISTRLSEQVQEQVVASTIDLKDEVFQRPAYNAYIYATQ